MSPEKASSIIVRSCARNCSGRVSASVLPVRTCFTSMPRAKRPEQMRTKAMRSRWLRIHVRLNLEDEARRSAARRAPAARSRSCAGAAAAPASTKWSRNGSTPKLVIALPKKTGVTPPRQERLGVEGVARRLQQRQLVAQLAIALLADGFAQRLVVQRPLGHRRAPRAALGAVEVQDLLGPAIVDAVEAVARADRPVHGAAGDAEHALDLVEQIQRLLALAVHLVDEGDDRDAAHAADLEQLDGLRLDPLDAVDQHHRRVGGRQRAVGVLAEVVVAGRVEQVHAAARGTRTAARWSRSRCRAGAPAPSSRWWSCGARRRLLDRAGQVDGAAVEQELLGQRGLARRRGGR